MEKNENIEIRRILDILRSKKILIALLLIVFILLGYWYSYHYVVPKYKSVTTLLLIPNTTAEDKTITNLELVMNAELINTYSNIATNSKILKQTIQNLALDMSEAALSSQVQVNIIDNTYIIEIAVSNTDPQKSMDIANELANVFLQEIKQIYNLSNIGVVDKAELAGGPYNINHSKDIAIFLAIGMIISFTGIMIIYIFDNTIKKEEDIENYIKVKSLGNIPIHNDKTQEIIDSNNAKSYMTECMNTIRTNILYMNSAKNAKTILITSCTPQEGKSWVSANIATSFAKINKKVLLIDADMRKGRAHKIFKVQNRKGLSNYLNSITGNIKKDIKLGKEYIQETKIPNLHILANGIVPSNPSELLGSNNMKELVALLKNIYDIIIVDAPPCKLVTDSIVLSTIMDSTVLVVNAEKTKISDLKNIKKSIKVVGGQIIGAILNKKKVSQKTYSKNDYYALTKQNNNKKVEEKQIISVSEVIEEALLKLRKTKANIFSIENKLISEKQEKEDIQVLKENEKQENINKFMEKQNEYLEKMINTISNIKVQIHNDNIKNKLKNKNSENKIKEFINTMQVEKIQQENYNTNYTRELNKILNQLEEVKQNHLTSNEMKEIVREEISSLEDRKKENLTKEEIESIIKQQVSHIDYSQEIVQINEMLTNLKDSYLELSNQIKNNTVTEETINIDNENNKNIIDFKAFKKQKNKKKVYSIEEDIFYHELEKIATCIIPIQPTNTSNSVEEKYFIH